MDEFGILLALAAGAFFLFAPVVSLIVAFGAKKQAQRADQGAALVGAQLDALRQNLSDDFEARRALQGRIEQLEAQLVDVRAGTAPVFISSVEVQVAPVVVAARVEAVPERAEAASEATSDSEAMGSSEGIAEGEEGESSSDDEEENESEEVEDVAAPAPAPAPAPPAYEPPPGVSLNWENLIGVRLFAWMGGAALFLGGVFFLQYSIQHALLSPPLRVAVGLGVGALALLGGDRLRARANLASEALSGAGVGILYASLFAARSLYHLIDSTSAFIGMALVTATAAALSVRRGSFLVALFGLLGGMATPYLVSTGEDRPLALLGYVILLDLGFLAVAHKRGWHALSVVGLVCSTLLFGGWSRLYLSADRAPWALLALALVACLYVGASRWAGRSAASSTTRGMLLLAALIPLAATVVFAGLNGLDVEPWFLAGYVTLLSLGAAWLAERGQPALFPAAVMLGAASLAARVDSNLFPGERVTCLVSFALPTLAVGAWVAWRGLRGVRSLFSDAALVIAAVGQLLLLLRVLDVESSSEPVLGVALFSLLSAALLVLNASIAKRGLTLALGLGAAFTASGMLGVRYDAERVLEFSLLWGGLGLGSWGLTLGPSRYGSDRVSLTCSALALPAYFGLAYGFLRGDVAPGPLGALAVGAALLTLLAWRILARRQAAGLDESSVVLFAAITLGFVSVALPILVGNEWLTIGWALELVALCWLYSRLAHRRIPDGVVALWVLVSVRLFFNSALWSYHPRSPTPILNHYLYTFGVPVVAFSFGARLLGKPPMASWLPRALQVTALCLAFFLLNIEVADCFSEGETLTFNLVNGSLLEDMTYSLSWGAFALCLLAVGLARRVMELRVAALAVLTLALLKVTLHDLWALGGLYRVGSLIGVAAALLLVSFLTQRLVLTKDAT